jgi:hypothetical protein
MADPEKSAEAPTVEHGIATSIDSDAKEKDIDMTGKSKGTISPNSDTTSKHIPEDSISITPSHASTTSDHTSSSQPAKPRPSLSRTSTNTPAAIITPTAAASSHASP